MSQGEFEALNVALDGSGVSQTDWSAYERMLSKSSTVTLTFTAVASISFKIAFLLEKDMDQCRE